MFESRRNFTYQILKSQVLTGFRNINQHVYPRFAALTRIQPNHQIKADIKRSNQGVNRCNAELQLHKWCFDLNALTEIQAFAAASASGQMDTRCS